MSTAISRVQFLRGDFRGERSAIRPPWSLPESRFTDTCSRCGGCVDRCPTSLLRAGRGDFPEADFARGECDFCGECAAACAAGAIVRAPDAAPWSLVAGIGTGCLALNGVVCRTCGERCEAAAIRFQLVVGGVGRPVLDQALCTGCGACFAPCPVRAVEMKSRAVERPER